MNAGKGNPNWINTKARLAFCKLVEFGVQESERTLCHGDLAGSIETVGIYERFINYLQDTTNEMKVFFETGLNYLKNELHLNVDSIVAEWVDGAIGNNYPTPNRVLTNTETILTHYLETILFAKTNLAEQTQVFPTEGGSAAMVYIFNSLKENKLIQLGDKIAISSPIFTPYIQIPELND